jgi:hypothetical protein
MQENVTWLPRAQIVSQLAKRSPEADASPIEHPHFGVNAL